ncbi:hypothetical protein J7L36_00315 [bacterium]|nr:hypothetical protein [bacterium]
MFDYCAWCEKPIKPFNLKAFSQKIEGRKLWFCCERHYLLYMREIRGREGSLRIEEDYLDRF